MTTIARDAPLLVTERLEMWVPTKDEIWATHAINTEPETVRFLGHAHSRHDHFQRFSRNAGSWLLYGYGGFMVRERGSGRLLGNCGIFHSYRGLGEDFDDFPEAGWILRSDSVGQGFGMEAMGAVLPWFEREHGPQRIVCMISLGNGPSIKLAGKLGFVPLREAELPDGDTVLLLARPAA